eukprot:167898_1
MALEANLGMHPGLPVSGETTVILPFEEFSVDLEHNLGRANGNCYQRRPGIPGGHDGQIMVRLKKKRFIVIDYSIIPTPADSAVAQVTPHIRCPVGAGQQECNSATCTKVGVPVCLWDSEPDEPVSLYLRSGLCFTCQRLLNEKRRTQRKRKGDVNRPNNSEASATAQKRFRISGEILDLNPDAIIVNGPIEGTKHHGPGYEYTEIMPDVQHILAEASQESEQLSASLAAFSQHPPPLNSQEHVDIEAIYNKTFLTVSKGIFLLSQWKSSFDTIIATAAVAEKATEEALDGTSIADVVASAAAVAAAQSAETGEQASPNMIPLLLAADNKEDDSELKEEHKNMVNV